MTAIDFEVLLQGLVRWLADPGIIIFSIIISAVIVSHFGGSIIASLIRQTIRPHVLNGLTDEDAVKRQNTLISLFTTVLKTLVAIAAFSMVAVKLFPSVDFGPLFASAGIAGIAIGFGAQSIIKDFLSGVFIILENQYRVGDVVDIEGAAGTVEKLTIRSTILRDFDGNVHFLPNGSVSHVINKTMGFSKVNFSITIKPENDLDMVIKIINATGKKLADDKNWATKITEAPQFFNISSFTDVSVDMSVVGKTEPSEQWGVTSELRRRLLSEFSKAGVELAHAPLGISKK
ncbi:mechanosensitive ion channel family protein [Candidatus Saccharibacteria bacterium]|nr:mechanosensitive ion channel family protein [Candidatus Saccharibacteria bacterium]